MYLAKLGTDYRLLRYAILSLKLKATRELRNLYQIVLEYFNQDND